MSTKIYNVHKFSGTMPELMDHLQKYRILWLDYMKLKITNYVSMYPKAALLDMKSEYICLTNLIDIIRKQTNSKYNTNFDMFDIKGSACVMFHKRNIYVSHFTDSKAPDFASDYRFTDFHYQNQTDPWYEYDKDKLSEDEYKAAKRNWSKRKKVWDEIFGNKSCFSEIGLTFDFNGPYDEVQLAADCWEYLKKQDHLKEYFKKENVNA